MGTTIYASGGAQSQDGMLPIRNCKTCGNEIVFAKSLRTGKFYAVNISRGYHGQRFYVKANAHKCAEVMAQREADTAAYERGEAAIALVSAYQARLAVVVESGGDAATDSELLAIEAELIANAKAGAR